MGHGGGLVGASGHLIRCQQGACITSVHLYLYHLGLTEVIRARYPIVRLELLSPIYNNPVKLIPSVKTSENVRSRKIMLKLLNLLNHNQEP